MTQQYSKNKKEGLFSNSVNKYSSELLTGKFINHRRRRRFRLAAQRVMLLVVDSLKPGQF